MNRDKLITACVEALRACYNYYADKPLDAYVTDSLSDVLGEILPQTITTEDWQKLADDYRARVENEE